MILQNLESPVKHHDSQGALEAETLKLGSPFGTRHWWGLGESLSQISHSGDTFFSGWLCFFPGAQLVSCIHGMMNLTKIMTSRSYSTPKGICHD